MTENIEIVKIELKGFYDLCNRLKELETENEKITKDNKILSDELSYFMQRTADLEEEIDDMKNTRKYLTSDDAGKRFAQELLGGA